MISETMTSPPCNSVDYRKRFNRSRSSSDDSSSYSSGRASSPKPNLWYGDLTLESVQNLHSFSDSEQDPAVALVYVYGEWNTKTMSSKKNLTRLKARMQEWLRSSVDGLECLAYCGTLTLTEDSVDELEQLPPAELPALAVVSQKGYATKSKMNYLPLKPAILRDALNSSSSSSASVKTIRQSIQGFMLQVESDLQLSVAYEKSQSALRIFVAGDRSSVGKSSVCLYVPIDCALIFNRCVAVKIIVNSP